MSKSANGASFGKDTKLIDFVIENRIRLDALELVLKDTNPPLHEFYLEAIENLRNQSKEKFGHDLLSHRT